MQTGTEYFAIQNNFLSSWNNLKCFLLCVSQNAGSVFQYFKHSTWRVQIRCILWLVPQLKSKTLPAQLEVTLENQSPWTSILDRILTLSLTGEKPTISSLRREKKWLLPMESCAAPPAASSTHKLWLRLLKFTPPSTRWTHGWVHRF